MIGCLFLLIIGVYLFPFFRKKHLFHCISRIGINSLFQDCISTDVLYFHEMLRMEKLCRLVGVSDGQTATHIKGKPLEYAGKLYSEEHE